MTTIKVIADKAIAGVKLKITDAIIAMSLIEPTQGAYDSATGTTPAGETDHGTVDAVFSTKRPISDRFPDYVAGESDQLVFFNNVTNTTPPVKGWVLRGLRNYEVRAELNILANGTIFYAVVRDAGAVVIVVENSEAFKADGASKALKADGISNAKKVA